MWNFKNLYFSSMQKVKTAGFSETWTPVYKMTKCHIPGGHNPDTNVISSNLIFANDKLWLVTPMNLLQNCLQHKFMKTVFLILTATQTSNITSRFKSTTKLIYIILFRSVMRTTTGCSCFDAHLKTGDRSHDY